MDENSFFTIEKIILRPENEEQNNFICIYLQAVFNNLSNSLVIHMYLNL